jgi:hypothetical protein
MLVERKDLMDLAKRLNSTPSRAIITAGDAFVTQLGQEMKKVEFIRMAPAKFLVQAVVHCYVWVVMKRNCRAAIRIQPQPMEMTAIVRALNALIRTKEIDLYSDSKYVLDE